MTSRPMILGTRKGLLIFERNGADWRFKSESHDGVAVPYAVRDNRTGLTWACLDHGHWGPKLARSRDDGATWDDVPCPKYPEGAESADGSQSTLKAFWGFFPGGADEPKRIYLGTAPGGLFLSDDNGASFTLSALELTQR